MHTDKTRTITPEFTCGSLRRQFLYLALPLIGGNILQQFYNMTDSYVAGRFISADAFAAVGVAGTIMNLVVFMMMGCCSGISVLYSQLYGEQNEALLRRETAISLLLGLIFSAILSILGLLLMKPVLLLTQTPERILSATESYLRVVLACLFVTYLYNWCSAVLRSFGNSRMALYILALAVVLNIGLDLLFVISFHMGIAGTAVATVIAQLAASVFCLIYLCRSYPFLRFHRQDLTPDPGLIRKTVRYGLVSALHQSGIYIGKILIQGFVNGTGMDSLTAFTAATRIESLINSFGDSGCAAVSILTGQNWGAGRKDRVRQCLRQSMQLMAFGCIPLCALMAAAARPFTRLLIESPREAVLHQSALYLTVIAIFYILCFTGNAFVGFYKGLGMVQVPVIGTVLQMSLRILLTRLLIGRLKLAAIALASGLGWLGVNVYQLTLYRRRVAKILAAPEGYVSDNSR